MTTTDRLICDYLNQLDGAARGLPDARRADLLAEIREHITVAIAESPGQGEAAVRAILDRLGDPVDIVGEAAGDVPAAAASGSARRGMRGVGGPFGVAGVITALAMVVAGVFLPVAGSIVGAVLVWVLAPWPARHKLLVAVVWPIGFGLGGWFGGPGATESSTCTLDGTCTRDDLLPIEAQMGLGLTAVITAAVVTALVVRHDRRSA